MTKTLRLRGGRIVFPKVSVGATHAALLAAAMARGETAGVVGDSAGAGIGADRAQASQRTAPGAPHRRQSPITGDVARLSQRHTVTDGRSAAAGLGAGLAAAALATEAGGRVTILGTPAEEGGGGRWRGGAGGGGGRG